MDQAHKLRELIRGASLPCGDAAVALPPTVVVTGGKGGVGATTVALNLAAALVHGGRRVVFVDAAPNADAAHLAGVDVGGQECLADVVAGRCNISDAVQEGPSGLLILAGCWAPEAAPDRSPRAFDRLMRQLGELEAITDVLVIDSGSGMNEWTRGLWREANLTLLVSTPNDTAILDTYATLKRGLLSNDGARVHMLVNQYSGAGAASDAEQRLTAACQRFLGRCIERAPRLPQEQYLSNVWSEPSSRFGRSVNQLARFVGDLLSQSSAVTAFNRDIQPRKLAKC